MVKQFKYLKTRHHDLQVGDRIVILSLLPKYDLVSHTKENLESIQLARHIPYGFKVTKLK
jgi:hypothetical protein